MLIYTMKKPIDYYINANKEKQIDKLFLGAFTYYTQLPNVIEFAQNSNYVTIGSFCSIGKGLNLYLYADHKTKWISTYPFGHVNCTHKIFKNIKPHKNFVKSNGNIIIGNDVWIADNVTIMSGVTIGDGAIIASNTHVIKHVEPYSIVGGNPSTFIKYRFTNNQISTLLLIKWWNWPIDKINDNISLLCSDNIDDFIKKHT